MRLSPRPPPVATAKRIGLWRDAREFGHGNGIEATLNYVSETGGSANHHTYIDGDFYSNP